MDIMNDENTMVLIAPYDDLAAARSDFANLRREVRRRRCEVREAVLVCKTAQGKQEVLETSANHARSGAALGAGIGVLFGLLVPPFLASIALGAGAGALAAKFADHYLSGGLQREMGGALRPGSGVVLTMMKPGSKASVERMLAGAIETSTLWFSDTTIAGLEAAVADAMTSALPVLPRNSGDEMP